MVCEVNTTEEKVLDFCFVFPLSPHGSQSYILTAEGKKNKENEMEIHEKRTSSQEIFFCFTVN